MGLLELCLLSLLSPQEPVPGTEPPQPDAAVLATPAEAQGTVQDGDDDRAKLLAAERAGSRADATTLGQLAVHPNEKIAARATFLLGKVTDSKALPLLHTIVNESPLPAVRLQAMAALLRHGSTTSLKPAITALEDQDIGVRTLAAQLLGKLRRPAATDPLLALLEREAPAPEPLDPSAKALDVQATLLALSDLGASEHLLRAATAVQERPVVGAGESLSFYFQTLSPKLDRKQEVTLLIAVLAHREQLLRRYAIGRLGVLAEPTSAAALEGRLATEGPELRPLVEVALGQVRRDRTAATEEGLTKVVESAKGLLETGKKLVAKARTRWDALPEMGRWIVAGTPVSLLLSFIVVARLRRRRAAAAAAAQTIAMLAPSAEHLEEMAAEAEALAAAAEAEELAAMATNESPEDDADTVPAELAAEDDDLVRN